MKRHGEEISDIIIRGANTLGIGLPCGASAAFEMYYSFLEQRNKSQNLTAITGITDVTRLHFLDCIAILNAARFQGARVIDIGAGAGFPGLPIKIVEPSINLTLLDSTAKRITFLSELCAALGVSAAFTHARAEEAAHDPDMRERFDVALSRAVARLDALCELCLPFVRIGGVFIAMKGAETAAETLQAKNAVATLGAELADVYDYTIPETDIRHSAVVIRKTSQTPKEYPRRFARIKKNPL